MSEQTEQQPSSSKGRRQLVVIMTIALLTLGGSYLLFYLASTQGGWGTTNNGEFVQPPVQTSELGWPAEFTEGNWWLWVVSENGCPEACTQAVKDMRALHILLSKEAGRVRRSVSVLDGPVPALPEAYPKLERIMLPAGRSVREGVYVIDPHGNLVFRYAIDGNPKAVLEDLKKLLKVSQIG